MLPGVESLARLGTVLSISNRDVFNYLYACNYFDIPVSWLCVTATRTIYTCSSARWDVYPWICLSGWSKILAVTSHPKATKRLAILSEVVGFVVCQLGKFW